MFRKFLETVPLFYSDLKTLLKTSSLKLSVDDATCLPYPTAYLYFYGVFSIFFNIHMALYDYNSPLKLHQLLLDMENVGPKGSDLYLSIYVHLPNAKRYLQVKHRKI